MSTAHLTLAVGDVVQLDPEKQAEGFFAGCFMMVTEPKSWGAQGFICMPGERGTLPGRAYFRAKHEDMHYVGRAEFVPGDEVVFKSGDPAKEG